MAPSLAALGRWRWRDQQRHDHGSSRGRLIPFQKTNKLSELSRKRTVDGERPEWGR